MTTAGVTTAAVCFLSSCMSDTLYFSYKTVDDERWDKSDDVFFEFVPSRHEGRCRSYMLLRTNGNYPYKNLSLNIETKLKGSIRRSRLDFDVTPDPSSGFRHNDYIMPIDTFSVSEGDTLHIHVSHDMKKHILKGITDVGIKITEE